MEKRGRKWDSGILLSYLWCPCGRYGLKETQQKDAQGGKRRDETDTLSFRGNYSHSVDSKGRVSLPADFRAILEERKDKSIVLTNYISQGARCLEGFGICAWIQFEKRLREKSRFSAKLQQLENFYLSRAAECQLDKNGRVLIPNHLRSYAGIEKDVTFTSSIHGFRIWNTKVWDVVFADAEAALMDNPETFADIDI